MKKILKIVLTLIFLIFSFFLFRNTLVQYYHMLFSPEPYSPGGEPPFLYIFLLLLVICYIFLSYKLFSLIINGIYLKKIKSVLFGLIILIPLFGIFIAIEMLGSFYTNCGIAGCQTYDTTPCTPGTPGC